MLLKKNIGKRDRWIRLIIGFVLFGLAVWTASGILLVLALFAFFEAMMSWCLFYQITGKNTCSRK